MTVQFSISTTLLIGVYAFSSPSISTCLMEVFMVSSFASFFVSQKIMDLPWLPLYTWTTSASTAARWLQWHAMARCYHGNKKKKQKRREKKERKKEEKKGERRNIFINSAD